MSCSECGAYFEASDGRGRKRLTCGDACKKARVARQMRERYKWDESYQARANAPRTTCSKCGKPAHKGRGSKSEVICWDCRYAVNPPRIKAPKSCADCGIDCIRKPSRYDGKRYCLNCAKIRAVRRNVEKHRARRAYKRSLPRENYTLAEVQELSCHVCGPCGGLVDPMLSGLDEFGPTVDHIIPISKGGPDLRHNVQLAHRVCNLRKGARI